MTRINPTTPTALAGLLESLLSAPPAPEPEPLTLPAPQTEEEVVDMLSAILEPHNATTEEVAQARADAIEIRRRQHEHAQEVAEHQRTDPHWPRWRGAPPPGTEPVPAPAKKPRPKSSSKW